MPLTEWVTRVKDEPLTIRSAEISDYSACLPLFKLLYPGNIGPNFQNLFPKYAERDAILLAEASDKLLGILMGSHNLDIDCEGRIARVDAVVVDENHRMKGIGKRLVKCLARSKVLMVFLLPTDGFADGGYTCPQQKKRGSRSSNGIRLQLCYRARSICIRWPMDMVTLTMA
jgi:GNAT superfamily N-acetyltransferase